MYVAKFSRSGLRWQLIIFKKFWSSDVSSHQIEIIKEKRFFFRSNGYRWINKEMARIMFENKELEIIDG